MLLTDFLKMNTKLTVPNIQKAFVYVVQKLRYDPIFIPVLLSGRVNFNSFETPFKDSNSSEYVIKEIQSITNGLLSDIPEYKDYVDCVVGTIGSTDYGLTLSADTTTSGEEYFITQDTLECTTSDDTVVILNCYLYPKLVYPIIYSRTNKVVYDIQTMITDYGVANLSCDTALMMLVGPMALSFYNDDILNIALSKTLEHYTTQLINIFNNYNQTYAVERLHNNRGTSHGTI